VSQARDAGLSSVTCTIRASPESSPRYVSVCWLYRLRPSTLYDGSEPAFKTPPPFTASNSATRSVLAAPDGVAGAARTGNVCDVIFFAPTTAPSSKSFWMYWVTMRWWCAGLVSHQHSACASVGAPSLPMARVKSDSRRQTGEGDGFREPLRLPKLPRERSLCPRERVRRGPPAAAMSCACGSSTFYGPNGACEVGLEASDGGNRG
jgi:hypothetical protein